MLASLLFGLLITACNNPNTSTTESEEITTPESPQSMPTENEQPKAVILKANGINGISSGDQIATLTDQGILKKGELKTGEGDFEIWNIMDKNLGKIGYVLEHPQLEGQVGQIHITSDAVKTENGLGVGSTWADIRAAYPSAQVFGSEIEGITAAVVGAYHFQLDIRNWSYEVDEAKIEPDTKVTEIWLPQRVADNDLN